MKKACPIVSAMTILPRKQEIMIFFEIYVVLIQNENYGFVCVLIKQNACLTIFRIHLQ